MNDRLKSPLGDLQVNESDDGVVFAQGRYSVIGNPLFFSIKLRERDSLEGIDFDFIRERMADVADYTEAANAFLIAKLGLDDEHRGPEPLIAEPEFTFWGGKRWSILFAEGSLDICEPYGVMVNFDDTEVVGYDDLSDAEEI